MDASPNPSCYYYKDATDENCVTKASTLFQDLRSSVRVAGEFFTNKESFVNIHNHMKSSPSWKSVSQWNTGIEYTIQHPDNDIIVSDTNRGQKTIIFKEHELQKVCGSTACGSLDFTLRKVRWEELDCTSRSYHDAMYTWVKIKSEKILVYESERSSWNFHLAVVWQGSTKTLAENNEKQYLVTVSMGSLEKASADVMYTTASFMEKLMDALFHKSKSERHITLAFP
ncbi:unnamed protein product [Ectocarpus sp. 12 AP-2014]